MNSILNTPAFDIIVKELDFPDIYQLYKVFGDVVVLSIRVNKLQYKMILWILYDSTDEDAVDPEFCIKMISVEIKINDNIIYIPTSNSLIYQACRFDNYEKVIDALVEAGCDVNQQRRNGIIPLHISSERGNINTVKTLLKHGSNVNHRSLITSCTPIFVASYNGFVDIVQLLLDNGADVNDCNIYRQSLLWVSCSEGYIKVVELLLAKGAIINMYDMLYLMSPIQIACYNGHSDIVKLLIKNGAKFDE